ncbi:MAG: V-type ATP synthase subunit D [Ignisphaera sp.]|uniref:V-type ATP synthase subunit D n=1 Tax=Ignisphaera aggregans TaxID=334771 RepID=A0A7C4D087_9CREN
MSEVIRLSRVTKIELIRLRRRLALARRLHRILRDRMTLLIQDFYIALKKSIELRTKLNQMLKDLYPIYFNTLSLYGKNHLDTITSTVAKGIEILASTRNVIGITVPMMELKKLPENSIYVPVELSQFQLKREEILKTVIELAEYEKAMYLIGVEIAKLRRKVTMLEKILIPRILNTIRYLTMKFDEIEREEKVRSIKIKSLLAIKRGEML